jgi:NACalpha-BTF3-like transcription factor
MAKQEGANLDITDHRLEGDGNLVVSSSVLSGLGSSADVATSSDEGDMSLALVQADVDSIVAHLECTQAAAERALRKSNGDPSAAFRLLMQS